ncbi:PaaI family thioesterase [Metabacillus idriensis]|uniref:PaaI family thioesterase n=1 Tax=Metabacillus idriensis TaxID=324768 RepID=UPI0028141BDF|nr:PaaI family thioesterase [Metabacillus idriensis]MDR0137231.1 PaaI family thioesterase [Metabacillus idriensis]
MEQEELMHLLAELNEEDAPVLKLFLEGLKKKAGKENGSYIGALLHAQGEYSEKQFTLTIPNTAIIQNSLNIVHGGITATLLDSAMGSLVHHVLPEHLAAVTSEMKINYVAPGIGTELKCIATLIHKGSKTVVTEGKVFRDDGKLMAHCTASFFIIDRPKR